MGIGDMRRPHSQQRKKSNKQKLMSLGNALEFLAESWPKHHHQNVGPKSVLGKKEFLCQKESYVRMETRADNFEIDYRLIDGSRYLE